MAASRTHDEEHVDVRSEECSAGRAAGNGEQGLRVIVYRDRAFLIVGVYLASAGFGARELRYILRPLESDGGPLGSQ